MASWKGTISRHVLKVIGQPCDRTSMRWQMLIAFRGAGRNESRSAVIAYRLTELATVAPVLSGGRSPRSQRDLIKDVLYHGCSSSGSGCLKQFGNVGVIVLSSKHKR